jgi:hypothetical protein
MNYIKVDFKLKREQTLLEKYYNFKLNNNKIRLLRCCAGRRSRIRADDYEERQRNLDIYMKFEEWIFLYLLKKKTSLCEFLPKKS